jgi:hypothetical protein
MGLYLSGGIGPLRGSVRLSGRGGGTQASPEDVLLMLAGIAVLFGGTLAAMGLRGEGGITGRVFGVLYVAISLIALFWSPLVGTYFATSWVYYGLSKVNYFDLINFVLFDPPKSLTLDSIVLMFIQFIVMILGIALVLLFPPAVVYLILNRLHSKEVLELEPQVQVESAEFETSPGTNELEIESAQEVQEPTLGNIPPRVDVNQLKAKLSETLTSGEMLSYACGATKGMKSVIAIFTNQRIFFLEIMGLQSLEEFPLDHFVNASFSLGGFTFTSVNKGKMSLMVDKSDIERIKEFLQSVSIGTLSEREFRKAKSQKSRRNT